MTVLSLVFAAALVLELPSDPLPRVRYAAEELERYAERMGLPEKSLRVSLREDPAYGDDGFSLRYEDGLLSVAGGKRGVLYGVYEVLERFGGCRFFAPDCEKVPRIGRLDIPDGFSYRGKPAFDERYAMFFDAIRNPHFAAKLRITTPKLTEDVGGPAFLFDEKLKKSHSFDYLIDPKEYGTSHPEYFALVKGERRTDAQPCLTNPDVIRIAIEKTLARIRANYPRVKSYGLSQNDNRHFGCECPSCRAIVEREGSESGPVIEFINRVADAVAAEYPDVTIETLAYTYTRKPPKTLKMRPNTLLGLAAIECDYSRPYAENRFAENAAFATNIVAWGKVAPKMIVTEYVNEFTFMTVPHPQLRSIAPNLRFLRDNGVRRLYELGGYQAPHSECAELKTYLLGKLMWDPDQDPQALIDEFLSGYYGAAAPFVRTYLDELHSLERDEGKHPLTCYDNPNSPVFTDAFLARANGLWEKAAEAVRDDPQALEHVRWGKFCVDVTRIQRYLRSRDGRFYSVAFEDPVNRDESKFREMRDLARSIVPLIERRPNVRFAEGVGSHTCWRNLVREFAAAEKPQGPSHRTFIPGWRFRTTAGRGMIWFEGLAAYDRASAYRVRIRARRLKPGAPGRFSAAVKRKDGTAVGSVSVADGQLADEARWYDLAKDWTVGYSDTISFESDGAEIEGVEVFLPSSLSVTEENGVLKVLRGGKTLVEAIDVARGVDASDVKSSFAELPDGSKVWNRWSEVKDRRFRLEVAERADGAVEITMTGQADADSKVRDRLLNVDVPAAVLEGKRYDCVAHSYMDFKTESGRFDRALDPFFTRFLSADGLTWDFNPLGVGDSSGGVVRTDGGNQLNRNGVIGKWQVERTARGFRFSSGDTIRAAWGGFTGGKLVIREGTLADYDRLHLMRKFYYHFKSEPRHLVAFGSPKRGAAYAEGDVACGAEGSFGWVDDPVRRAVVGHPEGAYYSAIAGKGPATYRFGGLADGYYILDCAFGNYAGVTNRITLRANGERLLAGARVPDGSVRVFSRAVRVRGGRLDLTFSGEWLVSTLGLLPLLGDAEDFSMNRGFWVTDGFEPCALFRNADTKAPPVFGTYDETEPLPVPGTECAGTPRLPPAPVEKPAADDPGVAWMKTAKMKLLLANSVSLSEFDEPGSLERYIAREWAGQDVRAVMLSGMHSRHTYLGHIDRGVEAMGRMTAELHRHGIRVIDHNDATLLWNDCAGFRVMMARLGETIRTLDGRIPSWQLCYSNPAFRETYYAYLRRLVEKGVDGFQIDELEFWRHGCSCRHCRDAFRRDTGWTIPLNELDAAWNDRLSPLRRRWQDWRRKTTANWYVELRRRVKDLNPSLAISIYTTPDGFTSPLPRRNASIDQIELRRALNYFGTEMMTRSAMRTGRSLLPHARAKNILSGPDLPPVWTWYYNVDYPNNYFAWGLSMLAGQTPLLSDVPVPEGQPDFERFESSPAAWKRPGAEPVAEIALLFSAQSRDWNRGVEVHPETGVSFFPELFGTAQTLEAMHIPYEFIDDAALAAGRTDKYRVLFLGEAQCLSDAEVAAVRAFAAKGGTVRLSTRAGTLDEFGLPRTGRPFPEGANYVYADASHGAPYLLGETWNKKVWTLDIDRQKEAAFMREIEGWAAKGRSWRIAAPYGVFSSVWKEKGGAYAVQFLNGTGVRMKFGDPIPNEAPDPAFPSVDENIVITAPASAGNAAVAVSPDFTGERRLEVKDNADGTVAVTLPKGTLRAYVLVRLSVR